MKDFRLIGHGFQKLMTVIENTNNAVQLKEAGTSSKADLCKSIYFPNLSVYRFYYNVISNLLKIK